MAGNRRLADPRSTADNVRSADEAAGLVDADDTYPRPENLRLAGSYVNFYIANGAVIVPQFDDIHDQPALGKIAELFPDREIIGIFAREILLGGGNIHCISHLP